MASRSASPEPPGSPGDAGAQETILVGFAVRPHGLRGEVRIQIHSDVPDRFEPGHELWVSAKGRLPVRLRITSFRPVRGGGVIRFEGWENRDQAEDLRGARLEVARSEVPAAPAGLYYHFELVGCRCIDREHGDLGEVTDLVEDGGGILLEVESAGRRLSLPFVESFLETVDVAHKEIRWRLPAGLVEICASRS